MSLQAFLKTVSDGADMTFCGSVPQPGCGNWKSLSLMVRGECSE